MLSDVARRRDRVAPLPLTVRGVPAMLDAQLAQPVEIVDRDAGSFLRTFVIGLIAFLTVVDLFATQAILPALVRVYGVSPGAMGLAVNASTIGMAISGLGMALLSQRIDRRRG